MTKDTNNSMDSLTLGKAVEYIEHYAPQLLQPVPRALNRGDLGIVDTQPFTGVDIWNGYELSWLTPKGKPQVAILRCDIPWNSPNLVESKSFKLYLNSFNQTRVENVETLREMLARDLSACAGKPVDVVLSLPHQFNSHDIGHFDGQCIDDLDIDVEHYTPDAALLHTTTENTSECLFSHLLKSNCLITSQPDWASIAIRYEGPKIDRTSLLRYLISFRQHNEFHEQCVERIFCDIKRQCAPEKLSVYARYTRRGGLDINPFRSNFETSVDNVRLTRQ